ncbi:sugar phosphate permease [Tamaricihabitans halophyticus]|uniref:Sugar phosphate permease n=1 Tax=Tamaricihabitans halophyticus TaxID=1262583 RepID=A0A4R2QSU8_9PSEU|nr:MFS transporter [Tamaricihabitans halophyticus]TCP50141.1 sugar phosphate permease [Tamaricihabitans halophyticus]
MSSAEGSNRRALTIWGIAATVYFLAVFHRTSFGVAGLEAQERFGVGAAALGSFTVLQVGVYAAMQIPTGILVDRFGPRKIITLAATLLGIGQLLFAIADSYPLGLLARGVLGLGDAMTFVSVLRLVAAHFSARRYPVLMSVTGALGFVGNLVATAPLAALLAGPGWTAVFVVAGAVTTGFAMVVALRLRDRPAGVPPTPVERISPGSILRQLRQAWRIPGTRLGFWVHFATMFGPNVLTLVWGVPYLVRAQGMDAQAASGMLIVFVFGSMLGGPILGTAIGRRPGLRVPLVSLYLSGALVAWAVLLSWPGTLPTAALAVLFAFLSLGGPVSMIGFALAKDYNPVRRVGLASGVVNSGGFLATTVTTLLVGVLVQLTGPLGAPAGFRIALLSVVVALLFGSWRVAVWWRRCRAVVLAAQERGELVPVQLRRRRWDSEATPVPATRERVAASG